ncbi:hypothetical protein L8T19_15580 [Enterobacter bugandensis]|uniref:hypothetical protein n=1 Tax=Enterobacter TaxID=547 RepID=UPI001F19A060|nr:MULTISPECIES: hypothetical protein [Enterobacter]MCF8585051.1 hypothetical protein [Enterobacter asburiae]MCK6779326.1 hypothetical protein [Enterobacter bugandensis]
MFHYFLLTYSVDNIGHQSDERIANAVRDAIASLTLEDVKGTNDTIDFAVDGWDKLKNVETAIAGQIYFSGDNAETDQSKKDFAKKIIRTLFRNILRSKNATSITTTIQCAMLIGGADETFTFKITPAD